MNDYIVIGYRNSDRAYGLTRALFQVNNEAGKKSCKDVQDSIAEYAGEHPEIIYMVVLENDYRQIFRDMLNRWFGR